MAASSSVPSRNGKHTTEKTIPQSLYHKHIQRSKNAGNYFPFFRFYPLLFQGKINKKNNSKGRMTALFLQDLINLLGGPNCPTWNRDGKEYHLCTDGFLTNTTMNWSEDEVQRHLLILKIRGYVEILRKGDHGPRYLWIDFEKIETDLDEAIPQNCGEAIPQFCGNTIPQNCGVNNKKSTTYSSLKKKNKEKHSLAEARESETVLPCRNEEFQDPRSNGAPSSSHKKSPANGFHDLAAKLASDLKEMVLRRFPDMYYAGARKKKEPKPGEPQKPPRIDLWKRDMQKCINDYGEEEVRRVLGEHLTHSGTNFWPEAYSPQTFRLKFTKIRNAIKRMRGEVNGNGQREKFTGSIVYEEDGEIYFKITSYYDGDLQSLAGGKRGKFFEDTSMEPIFVPEHLVARFEEEYTLCKPMD